MEKMLSAFLTLLFLLGQLFGIVDPSIKNKSEGIYNYCPSAFQAGDATRYIYYCTNEEPYDITDYIGFRKGTLKWGKYEWSEEKTVLAPTEGSWDAHHTCDPSVIKGDFKYNGEKYEYLMAYLGCSSWDNQDNKIGLAVSSSPEEEFIKVGDVPFIDYIHDEELGSEIFQWGVGQPSLVNTDKKSEIKLFYTCGDKYGTRVEYVTFDGSDLSNIRIISSGKVTNNGLINLNGKPDYLNNADFAYDSKADTYYTASDCHPNPESTPNYISGAFRITSIKASELSTGEWSGLCEIGKKETHFARNHNVGILRDEYGHFLDNRKITVYYTISEENTDESLWTYRIYERKIMLSKK